MKDRKEFYSILKGIEGRRYDDYQQMVGDFDFARYVLKVNNIEPEGSPSMVMVWTLASALASLGAIIGAIIRGSGRGSRPGRGAAWGAWAALSGRARLDAEEQVGLARDRETAEVKGLGNGVGITRVFVVGDGDLIAEA